MVELDVRGHPRVAMTGFDHVRVKRALGEKMHLAGDMLSRVLENLDEAMADTLAFFLRIGDAGKVIKKCLGGIDHAKIDVKVIAESRLDQLALVFSKEAIINKDAG